jgi:hypothetical protein
MLVLFKACFGISIEVYPIEKNSTLLKKCVKYRPKHKIQGDSEISLKKKPGNW